MNVSETEAPNVYAAGRRSRPARFRLGQSDVAHLPDVPRGIEFRVWLRGKSFWRVHRRGIPDTRYYEGFLMNNGSVELLKYANDTRPVWERVRDRATYYRGKALRGKDRRRLRNHDFTIISNDCWGAEVYQHLGLPYNTPFVGGFLFAPCFLRLLTDLRRYLTGPTEFTRASRYQQVNERKALRQAPDYPIAVLGGDVEIHYIHYTDAEARVRYERRVERINFQNIFLKASDGKDLWTASAVEQFDSLDYSHKLCFTEGAYPGLRSVQQLKRYSPDGAMQFYRGLPQFDVVGWLNDQG